MSNNRMTIRHIEPATYQFLVRRAEELSTPEVKFSVNQVVSLILNQHCRNEYFRQELTEVEKVTQRMDSLTTAVSDLAMTYQELLEKIE